MLLSSRERKHIAAMRRWLTALVLSASPLGAQVLAGKVIDARTGEALGYAIVSVPARQLDGFASDSGEILFGGLPAGQVMLRVRRLGYQPLDTVVTMESGARTEVRLPLTRIAVQLRGITVDAPPPCHAPGPTQIRTDSALAAIVSQVKLNAEQYRFLAEHYPFEYTVEIIRSSRLKADSQPRIDAFYRQVLAGKPQWNYKPGGIIARVGLYMTFRIPTLVDFADKDFLANHCFHVRGMEEVDTASLLRLDVVAAEKIKDPDVNGSIYLDPSTFQIRRTVMRLSRISGPIRHLADFEVRTDFREILPSIPVIADVYGVQTIAPDQTKSVIDMSYEEQRLMSLRWLKRAPGEHKPPTPQH